MLGRVLTACAAVALAGAASRARGADDLVIGLESGGAIPTGSPADEPAAAHAAAGPSPGSCAGDGLAIAAVRGAAESAPGSRSGALFRSILVPGYGQLYNGQRVKGGVLLGTEVALLSTALAFHLAGDGVLTAYNRQARAQVSADPTGRVERSYEIAQARYRVRDALLLAATGVWALNIVDAYLSGGRMRPLLDAGQACSERGGGLAPLAAIRPGHAILGLQGRF